MKIYFIVLFLLCFSKCQSGRIKNYEPDTNSGEDTFECTYSRGSITINPSLSKALSLELTTKDNNAKVWIMHESLIVDVLLLKQWVFPHATVNFTVGPYEGLHVELQEPGCTNETQARYRFGRIDSSKLICDLMLNIVGHSIKIVQYRKQFDIPQNCPYIIAPRYQNETVYLLSPTNIQVRTDGQMFSAPDTLITLRNFKSSYFFMNYTSPYITDKWFHEVIAVSTNKSCSCGNATYNLNSTETILLSSPGYPDFLCPRTSCNTLIKVGEFEKFNGSEKYVRRILVSVVSYAHHGVNLSLKQENIPTLWLDSTTYSNLSTSLLLTESDLTVIYETGSHLSTGFRGNYRMIVRKVLIEKECDCSTLTDNSFKTNFSMKVDIPSHCLMMSCFWRIGSDSGSSGELTFGIENGDKNDEIHFWNKNTKEIYKADDLKEPKKMVIENEPSTTQLVFWRTDSGTNATISLSWKVAAGSEENDEKEEKEEEKIETATTSVQLDNDPGTFTHEETIKGVRVTLVWKNSTLVEVRKHNEV